MTLKSESRYDENKASDNMEIQLTEQEQAQLRDVAQRTGRNTEDVVREAIHSFLQHEIEFVEAVEKGLASLDRGEYITHEEVTSRIDNLFRP
jgi:predicted transcriptional regulator